MVPSRADSLPYVVIEAGGAGIPIIASGVGGIPEILGPEATWCRRKIRRGWRKPSPQRSTTRRGMRLGADRLRERVRTLFSQDAMVEGVLAGYGEAIKAKFMHSH